MKEKEVLENLLAAYKALVPHDRQGVVETRTVDVKIVWDYTLTNGDWGGEFVPGEPVEWEPETQNDVYEELWQALFAAPKDVGKLIDAYNDALREAQEAFGLEACLTILPTAAKLGVDAALETFAALREDLERDRRRELEDQVKQAERNLSKLRRELESLAE